MTTTPTTITLTPGRIETADGTLACLRITAPTGECMTLTWETAATLDLARAVGRAIRDAGLNASGIDTEVEPRTVTLAAEPPAPSTIVKVEHPGRPDMLAKVVGPGRIVLATYDPSNPWTSPINVPRGSVLRPLTGAERDEVTRWA